MDTGCIPPNCQLFSVHVTLQPLGKQFLLPVEKGFGSRGRGAYRLPYNIGMPHVILHRYNDQTDPHYTEQTEP